ncbi:amino acid efflux protein [Bordetella ansorpii]|uniref:Amino acid efflux protein n=1 Tax=Bordetella ansorpii TaxID=288768 RepID=A0A157R8M0_9BORD|nr:LysE family transporter [Bordetella ansorpii]SAI54236.1 amino acid efflux protein [Bordetella ansorpii]
MQFNTWLLLLVTTLGISLTPGPNALLVLTHGAMHGSRRTLSTIAGGLAGFVAMIALCLFGIAALVQASVHGLTALKWIGGAYLIWLGAGLWRAPPMQVSAPIDSRSARPAVLFRQGLFSALANPKALLLFSAFLPQFIDPHRSLLTQFVVVTATYLAAEFVVEYLIAATADRVRPWLGRMGRRFNRVCGGLFVAVGALLPLR